MPSFVHPVVCYGETLWTILPTGKQAGGSPVRIACHLQQLGMKPAVVSRIGYDELGKELIEALEAKDICTDYFQMDEEKLTGVATAYVRDGYETVYTIYNDAAWDGIECTNELPGLIAGAGYFVYDSLAARCRESFHTLLKLLAVAETKVLHLYLCSPFYNRTLIEDLLLQADIVVLTRSELELITGWFSNYNENAGRIRALQEQCNIPVVALIDNNEEFILAAGGSLYTCKRFAVQEKDSGISPDAFVAGLIAKLSAGAGYYEALMYAAATAIIGHDTKDAFPFYHTKQIDDLLYANR